MASVRVAKEVLDWLDRPRDGPPGPTAEQSGFLVGAPKARPETPPDILGALGRLPKAGWQEDRRAVQELLPAGLEVLGVFVQGSVADATAALAAAMGGAGVAAAAAAGGLWLAAVQEPAAADSSSGGGSGGGFRFYSCATGQVSMRMPAPSLAPATVKLKPGADLLLDYCILRYAWARRLESPGPADGELDFENTHLYATAASRGLNGGVPRFLPIPLHGSTGAAARARARTFEEVFSPNRKPMDVASLPLSPSLEKDLALAAAATEGPEAGVGGGGRKKGGMLATMGRKRSGSWGPGPLAQPLLRETQLSAGIAERAATLNDMLRHTCVGPVLDVQLLHRRSCGAPPEMLEPHHHGPAAMLGAPMAAPAAPAAGGGQSRRVTGELLVYVDRREPFGAASEALMVGLARAWEKGARLASAPSAAAAGQQGGAGVEVLTFHAFDPSAPGRGGSAGICFPLAVTLPLALAGSSSSNAEEDAVHAPGQESDREDLRQERWALHTRLGLPLNRPVFRSTNALRLGEEAAAAQQPSAQQQQRRLRDVHIGLPPSGVPGGTQHLVDGSYYYHHYNQDHVDDKGWGCAYRSLQTIVSFFRLNGYTTKPVPTHREIQQTLVDIGTYGLPGTHAWVVRWWWMYTHNATQPHKRPNAGDKPPSFLGSTQWIGSMEVGYWLDQELGLSWRSVSTATGPELASKARELAEHFDKQGTPVMMGGGNLAFTVLGVDWCEATGEVKFLILDPHYTGSEDLAAIQGKEVALEGYRATACGWRSPASFSKQSFYNLCLPQRPNLY